MLQPCGVPSREETSDNLRSEEEYENHISSKARVAHRADQRRERLV
jgi:hypothetical protein